MPVQAAAGHPGTVVGLGAAEVYAGDFQHDTSHEFFGKGPPKPLLKNLYARMGHGLQGIQYSLEGVVLNRIRDAKGDL